MQNQSNNFLKKLLPLAIFLLVAFVLFKILAPMKEKAASNENENDFLALQQITQEKSGIVGEIASTEFDPTEFLLICQIHVKFDVF